MPKKSEGLKLLELLEMEDLRTLADHYEVPRARSAEEQRRRLIQACGRRVEVFVNARGPFGLEFWKDLAEREIGAARQKTWEATAKEISFRLVRPGPGEDFEEVFDEVSVSMIRNDSELAGILAGYVNLDAADLIEALGAFNGRTLIMNIYDELLDWASGQSTRATSPRPAAQSRRGTRVLAAPTQTVWQLPKAGVRVNNRWDLGRRVGAGGFGEAYLATDRQRPNAAPVVLKFAIGAVGAEALHNELDKALEVAHRNLCRYLYIDESSEYGPFLVLQYAGCSLADKYGARPASPPAALPLIRQAAAGLDALHDVSIIHGDISPANILVDDRGIVRITDFGISAHAQTVAATDGNLTRVATMHRGHHRTYSAPEAQHGQARPASDQYSLALVYCALLCGTASFPQQRQTNFDELTDEQNRAIARALSFEPRQRFRSCSEFAAELER